MYKAQTTTLVLLYIERETHTYVCMYSQDNSTILPVYEHFVIITTVLFYSQNMECAMCMPGWGGINNQHFCDDKYGVCAVSFIFCILYSAIRSATQVVLLSVPDKTSLCKELTTACCSTNKSTDPFTKQLVLQQLKCKCDWFHTPQIGTGSVAFWYRFTAPLFNIILLKHTPLQYYIANT